MLISTQGSGSGSGSVSAILDELDAAQPPTHSQRRHERRVYRRAYTTIVLTDPNRPQVQLTTRNISPTGLGFVSLRPFKRGEKFLFSFALHGATKLILCRVVYVRLLRSKFYSVGASFGPGVSQPTGQEMIPLSWLELGVTEKGVVSQVSRMVSIDP